MASTLTHDVFRKSVNGIFRISSDPHSLDLELMECRRLASHPWGDDSRDPFSLTFRGPLAPVLPQRIYSLQNERMGELQIFLVPIGPDGTGMRYEAIFT